VTPPLAYVLYLGINENQRERAVAALKKRMSRRQAPAAAPAAATETGPAGGQ
jgi:hypothetical protein